MATNVCPQCGAPLEPGAIECKFCGEKLATQQAAQSVPPQGQTVYIQQAVQPTYVSGINPAWPVKNKVVAGVLVLLLGGLGFHKFYLGNIGMGIVHLIFSWTFIPATVAFFEGIIYLTSSDENFQLKNHVRVN